MDTAWKAPNSRREFIGGSDARIIMGGDEARLIRLWREKRGEREPEDLSQDLVVQLGSITEDLNRTWYERNSGNAVEDVQRRMRHPVHKWMGTTLDGRVRQTGAVFEAKFMLPWNFSEEAAAEKHMAQLQHNMWVTKRQKRGSLDHHGRRKVGRDHDLRRSAVSAPSADGREEVLALRSERRAPSPVRCRTAEASARGCSRRGYDVVQQLGRVCRNLSADANRLREARRRQI